jgi:hypothetical protein
MRGVFVIWDDGQSGIRDSRFLLRTIGRDFWPHAITWQLRDDHYRSSPRCA